MYSIVYNRYLGHWANIQENMTPYHKMPKLYNYIQQRIRKYIGFSIKIIQKKIELYKENGDLDGVFKGSKLSNCSNLVFLRNSQNGKVIAKVNQKSINLNSELHKND